MATYPPFAMTLPCGNMYITLEGPESCGGHPSKPLGIFQRNFLSNVLGLFLGLSHPGAQAYRVSITAGG